MSSLYYSIIFYTNLFCSKSYSRKGWVNPHKISLLRSIMSHFRTRRKHDHGSFLFICSRDIYQHIQSPGVIDWERSKVRELVTPMGFECIWMWPSRWGQGSFRGEQTVWHLYEASRVIIVWHPYKNSPSSFYEVCPIYFEVYYM